VTQAAGFRYRLRRRINDQFIHSGALMICTPDGHLSKYLYGAEYAPNDVRLAVADASVSKIGSLSDSFCCTAGITTRTPANIRWPCATSCAPAAALTLGAVGLFVGINLRRERQHPLPDTVRPGRTA
jgi:protein SCO1